VQSINEHSIEIKNDHLDTVDTTLKPHLDWQEGSAMELIAYLARGGIAGLGGAVFSTSAKLAAHRQYPIETLIINGMECEPYITCDDYLMREHAASILHGVQILLHACSAPHALIAIEDDKPLAIAAMRNAITELKDHRLELRVLPAVYPQGDEGQLIRLLLNKEIPRGHLPSKLGVVVHNVATAHACAQWILEGMPLISRVVTVSGHGVREPQNVSVRMGTPCADVIAFCGGYQVEATALIMGGAMMGRALHSDKEAITKATNCLIVATEQDIENKYREQPCIRCGECMHACPAGLLPQQLLMYLRNQDTQAATELGLGDCIECGCCDAVCPSHIPLASRFRAAKLQLQR
jgi:electron transport complex protein RnfC